MYDEIKGRLKYIVAKNFFLVTDRKYRITEQCLPECACLLF